MSTGFWLNNDGLPLQFGTQKAIPEMGGDYLMYGENREIEIYIAPAGFTVGSGMQVPALPTTFSGTTTPIAAGIQSMTTLFPLQITAPVTTSSGGLGLVLTNTQLYIDQVDLEVLVGVSAGTGGATGLTGIGLAYAISPPAGTAATFAQVAPNAGVQLMGAATNAKLATGMHYTWYADGSEFGTGTPPTAGSWLGNVPLVTSFQNAVSGALPNQAFISVLASGGTFSGTTATGLLRLRVRYNIYGAISY
jgi:hypothetical protein